MPQPLPDHVDSEAQLEDLLSRPSPADIAFMKGLSGDIAIVGAGGKMGPSLARRARRAAEAAGVAKRIAAVSRFSEASLARALEASDVEAISCDLLDPAQVARLPDFGNVLFLAGMKFGASARPDLTWAMNTMVPAHVARRYRDARIVAFSTGNVYPLTPVASNGAKEADTMAPVGEYAQSCLGRERVFEHFANEHGARVVLFRLFYAVDLRYGVLVDIARKVLAGEAIDLGIGHANVIWQGDANSYALRSLGLAAVPALPLNVTGPETLAVRAVAERFGERLGRPVGFTGSEGPLALLGNTERCQRLLGAAEVSFERLFEWCAHWVESGGRSLGKPTKYERTDGRF
jgi:nucleoside-diphosphate-sugar epimerase